MLRTGDNRITWISGCCDGDLVIVDFHDSHGDGNEGDGLLSLSNSTSGLDLTYRIGAFADMTWKTYGPFCAPAGAHTLTFTSDANPEETTFQVFKGATLTHARCAPLSPPRRWSIHMAWC